MKMKQLVTILLIVLPLVMGCKEEKKNADGEPTRELDILEKVAFAHGYENWKNVEEIRFTFNVDRDTSHFERKWIWKPKTNGVIGISAQDTIVYNRNAVDSTSYRQNGAFVNDKYWLLAPFNLMWDRDNLSYEHSLEVESPIGKTNMQKLTIVYNNEGGYTPGDAYDFYFGEDYLLKEWVFRKGNRIEPSMITTWEDYTDIDGLKLAGMHKKADDDFKLYLSHITVKTK